MKVVERIFEYRIQQQIDTDDMQSGFMKGKGTADAIFMVGLMQETFRANKAEALFSLCGFGKSF